MLGLLAVVLATVNMVGGFVVTDRMLEMFGAQAADGRRRGDRRTSRERPRRRRSSALGYLVAAVCFILALKGLSVARRPPAAAT